MAVASGEESAHDSTPLVRRGAKEQWPVASECEAEELAGIEKRQKKGYFRERGLRRAEVIQYVGY